MRKVIMATVMMMLIAVVGCQSEPTPEDKLQDQKTFRTELQGLTDARAAGDEGRVTEIVSRMRQREDIQKQLYFMWGLPESADGPHLEPAPKEQRLTAAWLWERLYGINHEDSLTGMDAALLQRVAEAEEDPEVLEELNFVAR